MSLNHQAHLTSGKKYERPASGQQNYERPASRRGSVIGQQLRNGAYMRAGAAQPLTGVAEKLQ